MINISWEMFYPYLQAKGTPPVVLEDEKFYTFIHADGAITLSATIAKNDEKTALITSYLANRFPPIIKNDSDGFQIVKQRVFTSNDGLTFKGQGICDTVIAGQIKNIDYKLTETRYMNGAHLILSGHVAGDNVDFSVVDVDNIYELGAGTVLDKFADSWFVSTDSSQGTVIIPYATNIPANLYVRVTYRSTGANDVKVFLNMFLHKEKP